MLSNNCLLFENSYHEAEVRLALVATKQHNEKIRLDKISVNGKTTCIGGLGGLADSSVDSFFSFCVNKQ